MTSITQNLSSNIFVFSIGVAVVSILTGITQNMGSDISVLSIGAAVVTTFIIRLLFFRWKRRRTVREVACELRPINSLKCRRKQHRNHVLRGAGFPGIVDVELMDVEAVGVVRDHVLVPVLSSCTVLLRDGVRNRKTRTNPPRHKPSCAYPLRECLRYNGKILVFVLQMVFRRSFYCQRAHTR